MEDIFVNRELSDQIRDISHSFGMSKMTVVNESTLSHQYESLEFPEFIEFLARMAY